MDFILQRIDKVIRTYGNEKQIALVTTFLEFPWLRNSLRKDLIIEAKAVAAEHGTEEEYDDMCAVAAWFSEDEGSAYTYWHDFN